MKRIVFAILFIFLYSGAALSEYSSYFSPQDNLISVVANQLKKANDSVDISIYSFRNDGIRSILMDKLQAGVKVRIVINNGDSSSVRGFVKPLTNNGADIRHVSKINHHKFVIIDQDILVNSSGNLTGTSLSETYDENMVVCDECDTRISAYQYEFEQLHSYGSPVNPDYAVIFPQNFPSQIETNNFEQVLFTSSNFIPYLRNDQVSFKKNTRSGQIAGNVDSVLVDAINNAKSSLHIATGHFRSKPLYDAVIAAVDRGVDVNIVVDGQEYISSYAQRKENKKVEECMEKYDSVSRCYKKGLHFGRLLSKSGANIRFKYYMLSWSFPTAPQMHNKYMVVDGETLYSGSYNWSYNAEFESFENVGIYKDQALVSSYLENFEVLSHYGNANEGYIKQLEVFNNATAKTISNNFAPISITAKQIDALRTAAYHAKKKKD